MRLPPIVIRTIAPLNSASTSPRTKRACFGNEPAFALAGKPMASIRRHDDPIALDHRAAGSPRPGRPDGATSPLPLPGLRFRTPARGPDGPTSQVKDPPSRRQPGNRLGQTGDLDPDRPVRALVSRRPVFRIGRLLSMTSEENLRRTGWPDRRSPFPGFTAIVTAFPPVSRAFGLSHPQVNRGSRQRPVAAGPAGAGPGQSGVTGLERSDSDPGRHPPGPPLCRRCFGRRQTTIWLAEIRRR